MVISCLANFLTLMMEATRSCETMGDFQRTTGHYIPEDRTLLTQAVHIVKTCQQRTSGCQKWRILGANLD
jgi:hypothetical protein